MIRQLLFFAAAALVLLFGGCSDKQYYKPDKTLNSWPVCKEPRFSAESITGQAPREDDIPKWPPCRRAGVHLASKTGQGAVAQKGWVLDPDGITGFKLPESQRFLGVSDGWIISTNIDGNVTIKQRDGNQTNTLSLGKTVASAAVSGDLLAVLFASNDMGIYTLSTGKSYFKSQGTPATAVDVRVAAPYFLGSLVIFPTLDGRFVVVDTDAKVLLRSTVVSSEEYFDNIFYFNVIGNTMVAATQHRLFSLSDKERREKYDLRDVAFDDEGIWITTKEGEVVHLSETLQPLAKKKFPFAHFLGMVLGKERIYLLEKEGFLIVMDKAMQSTEVYKVMLDDGVNYTSKHAFYVRDKIITVE